MDEGSGSLQEQARGWLARARAGDQQALGRLMALFRDYLLVVANGELASQVQPKVAPSDVVQDTFLEGYRLFERFGGEEVLEFRAWLRAILLHKVADLHDKYLVAQKRQVSREVSLDQSGEGGPLGRLLAHDGGTASAEAVAAEELHALLRALEGLPEPARQVIVWRVWERLPFAEIGRRLGRHENAARMLFVRALERLQAETEQHHERPSLD